MRTPPETVGDLDPDTTVYLASTVTSRKTLHLDEHCDYLQRAREIRECKASVRFDTDPICRRCSGLEDGDRPHSHEFRTRLLETDPEEVGLSPMLTERASAGGRDA